MLLEKEQEFIKAVKDFEEELKEKGFTSMNILNDDKVKEVYKRLVYSAFRINNGIIKQQGMERSLYNAIRLRMQMVKDRPKLYYYSNFSVAKNLTQQGYFESQMKAISWMVENKKKVQEIMDIEDLSYQVLKPEADYWKRMEEMVKEEAEKEIKKTFTDMDDPMEHSV